MTHVSRDGRPAAFFDVDRTVVRVNTANLYMRWRYRRGEASAREVLVVAKWMMQYALGWVDPQQVTARALGLLQDVEEESFRHECRDWYAAMVRRHVTAKARSEIERRKRDGYECALLTASTAYATAPLAEELGINHVLCTKLEVLNGRFTGGYIEPLCYAHGKVEVAERWARQQSVDLGRSAFYTDSISDLPMLQRVGEPRVVNPDPRLRIRATLNRWPIEQWR